MASIAAVIGLRQGHFTPRRYKYAEFSRFRFRVLHCYTRVPFPLIKISSPKRAADVQWFDSDHRNYVWVEERPQIVYVQGGIS